MIKLVADLFLGGLAIFLSGLLIGLRVNLERTLKVILERQRKRIEDQAPDEVEAGITQEEYEMFHRAFFENRNPDEAEATLVDPDPVERAR